MGSVAHSVSEIRSQSDRDAIARIVAAEQHETIENALEAARQRLGMDVAYVSTITPEVQRFDVVSGNPEALGIGLKAGAEVPIEQTYCSRMLNGAMPNIVPDTSLEPAVQNLAATKFVGAYAGVPIVLSDGRVHGTLCASSANPREDLGEDELRFMHVLAQLVAERIEQAERRLA
jgi:GAF domain-containing protein